MFGGPWLLAGCGRYGLSTGQWTPFAVSSQCPGDCGVIAIGRYWAKVESAPNGRLRRSRPVLPTEPFDRRSRRGPRDSWRHDLRRSECAVGIDSAVFPAALSGCLAPRGDLTIASRGFYGPPTRPFALTITNNADQSPSYRLARCGSSLNLSLPRDGGTESGGYGSPPIASSSAVVVAGLLRSPNARSTPPLILLVRLTAYGRRRFPRHRRSARVPSISGGLGGGHGIVGLGANPAITTRPSRGAADITP